MTPACKVELEYLKNRLVSNPVLKPIDPNRDFTILTDASTYRIGFTICQEDDDGNLHVVWYGSYATTPSQSNYSADDLEGVVLMYALQSIECLVLCRYVTVITDNSHVLHIADWKPQNRTQRRMLTYIMQYRLTVKYVRGVKNITPDCLSKLFQNATVQERRENEPQMMHDTDDFILPVTTRSCTKRASLDDDTNSTDLILPLEPDLDAHVSDTDVKVGNAETSDPQDDESSTTTRETQTRILDDVMTEVTEYPIIAESDYESDDEFGSMYKYLQYGHLTGDSKRDKTTLTMADRYIIDNNNLLYRIDVPRQKTW